MSYVIAPLQDVKGLNHYPEYIQAMEALDHAARSRAMRNWGQSNPPGGIFPTGVMAGVGPFRKNDMANDTADNTPSGSYTFRKTFTATGWTDIFNYTVRKDMIHAFAGFLVSDDVLRITQLRMRFGQNSFPILDIQEAQRYDRAAIIFKQDQGGELVVDQGSKVVIRVYLETIGLQRVVPLGFQLYRRADMVTEET